MRRSCGSFAIDARSPDMSALAGRRSPAAAANVPDKGSGKRPCNRRVRAAMVELALDVAALAVGQRSSPCGFRARVGAMGGGSRKIMIVALARKLLVALWRYVMDGVIPDGAKK